MLSESLVCEVRDLLDDGQQWIDLDGLLEVFTQLQSRLQVYFSLAEQRTSAMNCGSIIPLDESEVSSNMQTAKITSAEKRVLSLVLNGWTNDRIARELGRNSGTVRSHTYHMRSKLGVARSECLTLAILGPKTQNLVMRALVA